MEKLLIINPGSTSTKIALYDGDNQVFVKSISHSAEEVSKYAKVADQYTWRCELVLKALAEAGVATSDLTAVISRGGMLPPVETGAYAVNEDMVWQLINRPRNEHASSLGALIAYEISKKEGIPSYIYDCVTSDEMIPLTKLSGHPLFPRNSMGHHLNMRAAGMRYTRESGKTYGDLSLIIAHLGGGISVSAHLNGKTIDICNDENGAFSPERTGALPCPPLVKAAYSGQYSKESLLRLMKSQGGLVAYLGTNDSREVEKKISSGDEYAKLVYEAMALGVSKCIGEEAALLSGRVDAILLTGGIAYSKMFTDMIAERVKFIAPVTVYAGENEMLSLALGGLRVLRGEEAAKIFHRKEI